MKDEEHLKVVINGAELTILLVEAYHGEKRPVADPQSALNLLPPDERRSWIRAAQAATAYIFGVIEIAQEHERSPKPQSPQGWGRATTEGDQPSRDEPIPDFPSNKEQLQ